MKLKVLLILAAMAVIFSSCSTSSPVNRYYNTHSTNANVELKRNNFKVINYVSGSASRNFVFWVGGLSRKNMIEEARAEMFRNAYLIGAPRVILNESIETSVKFFLFYTKVKVTVSGYVYEFN